MGLMSFISKQFIDIIQWTDPGTNVLSYRYPMQDQEIQNGAQLVVREAQMAVFFNEGKFADKFGPGTYTLNTQTLPILTYLKNWDKAFESPFKSDVYFVSTREFVDLKWGTAQPITVRDKEFGPLRIRAFGNYSFKISDVEPFWTKLSGASESYTVDQVEGQLRTAIMANLSSFLAKSDTAFIDMAANQADFSHKLQEAVAPVFSNYGLELRSFWVQSISLPEELEKHLDRVSSMRMVGDLKKYAQFQAADSIPIAAANPGGIAGVGAGMGAGLAMGNMMTQALGGGETQIDPNDPIVMIERLNDLKTRGLLTQEEFDTKKAELLGKIK